MRKLIATVATTWRRLSNAVHTVDFVTITIQQLYSRVKSVLNSSISYSEFKYTAAQ